MGVKSGVGDLLAKWTGGKLLRVVNLVLVSWNIWDQLHTNKLYLPGNLLMDIKSQTIGGYLAPVRSISFGCLQIGGHMGHCGSVGGGVVSFLYYYIVNYQRL